MATRSFIGIQNHNGTVTGVYCHHDGYLEGVGKTLLENYNDQKKATQLVELGSLSSLGEDLDVTQAYHRDRGEDLDVSEYLSPSAVRFNDGGYEYIYLLTREGWLYAERHDRDGSPKYKPLASAKELL